MPLPVGNLFAPNASSISYVHASAALAWARKPNRELEPGSFYVSDRKKCKVRKQLNKPIHREGSRLVARTLGHLRRIDRTPDLTIWWMGRRSTGQEQSVSKIQSRSNSSTSTLCILNKSKMCMDIFSKKKICRPRIHCKLYYSMKMARGLTHCY